MLRFSAMYSVNRYNKIFPFKKTVADSIASLVFNQLNKLLNGPNLLSVSFYSLTNASQKTAKKKSKSAEVLDEERSCTVSYLIKSCGFSPETAVSASAKVRLRNSDNPDSVIASLEKYGFSRTQIFSLVRKRPHLLLTKEKTLLPKLEHLKSIGMSNNILATFITRDPTWLTMSLENVLVPNYNFLKSVLLTDERVVSAFKHSCWVFHEDATKKLAPNVYFLRELKVPESCIRLLLTHFPEALNHRTGEFRESVSNVLELGFDPLKSTFVLALHAISGKSNKSTWAQCYETYSKWGWSRENICMAFRKNPGCMLISENKISRTMDYLVNKVGLNSRMIAEIPTVIFFSLENRTIPRCSVIRVLLSRGLIDKKFKLNTILRPTEKLFLEKFVIPYEKQLPKLNDFYKGKVSEKEL